MGGRLQMSLVIPLCLVLLVSIGCGKRYQTVPVSGRVTLDGKPIAQAAVSFSPKGTEDGKSLPGAVGGTDERGNYKLQTIDGKDALEGAIPGEHLVIVSVS